ncbi:uncharacterized protein LOC62_01G001215 [Vanrija pseudolonga]|uniref:Uncharacterized protein n=1 Tax=Vanrija pseudolonga TaxID=143232 RepID=A0AAF0Y4N7_9TREE|nr:hypothetical protein LOC62_01G001215 [Vanrija pseudolonga]
MLSATLVVLDVDVVVVVELWVVHVLGSIAKGETLRVEERLASLGVSLLLARRQAVDDKFSRMRALMNTASSWGTEDLHSGTQVWFSSILMLNGLDRIRSPKRIEPSDSGCLTGSPSGRQKWKRSS